ncbi:hypothetical protein BDV98DRAFT_584596 [Pterulicium gracile]|uniref:Uncharacterized protein n=1 Tax=Pterulicium gracile TaxID=1884261 RepID=A0A5C3QAH2_9AGAR|nr:hypothetical protein BDV98DRAFT_584596 [Pterula gracilis]
MSFSSTSSTHSTTPSSILKSRPSITSFSSSTKRRVSFSEEEEVFEIAPMVYSGVQMDWEMRLPTFSGRCRETLRQHGLSSSLVPAVVPRHVAEAGSNGDSVETIIARDSTNFQVPVPALGFTLFEMHKPAPSIMFLHVYTSHPPLFLHCPNFILCPFELVMRTPPRLRTKSNMRMTHSRTIASLAQQSRPPPKASTGGSDLGPSLLAAGDKVKESDPHRLFDLAFGAVSTRAA